MGVGGRGVMGVGGGSLTCRGWPGGRSPRGGCPHEHICQLQACQATLQGVGRVIDQVCVGIISSLHQVNVLHQQHTHC